MTRPVILVVDDQYARDPAERQLFLKRTELHDESSSTAASSGKAFIGTAIFCSGQREHLGASIENDYAVVAEVIAKRSSIWAIVLLDMRFDLGAIGFDGTPKGNPDDDTFGEFVRQRLSRDFPNLPVVILTSKQHIDLINRDVPYLSKEGIDTTALTACLLRYGDLTVDQTRELLALPSDTIAAAPATIAVFRHAWRAARGSHSILITGETGVGKEILARYVHQQSGRSEFVDLNVATIPPALFESEMFGAVKGAFTNLTVDRTGFFEKANRGTLFLDEIGDMDMDAQAKILRAIEEKKAYRIGSRSPYTFDVRLISATSRHLDVRQAPSGQFRSDLYYRIAADVIDMPPLRDRKQDITPLANQFLQDICHEQSKSGMQFTNEALSRLSAYEFPGNVRELKHLVIRAVIAGSKNQAISATDVNRLLIEQGKGRDKDTNQRTSQTESRSRHSRAELTGALMRVTDEFGRSAAHLIEIALDATRHVGKGRGRQLGDLNPTAAMKLLLDRTDLTTAQAADEIKRIGGIVDRPIAGSDFAKALEWARGLRRAESKVSP